MDPAIQERPLHEDDLHDFNGEESILGLWPRVPHANVLVFDKKEKEAFVFDSAAIRLQDLGTNDPEYVLEMERWLLSEFPEYNFQYFNRFNDIPRSWLLQYQDRCCVSWMTLLCYLMINFPDGDIKKGFIKNYEGDKIPSRSAAILKFLNRDTFIRYLYVIYLRFVRIPKPEIISTLLDESFEKDLVGASKQKKRSIHAAKELLFSIYHQNIEIPLGYKTQHVGFFWLPSKKKFETMSDQNKLTPWLKASKKYSLSDSFYQEFLVELQKHEDVHEIDSITNSENTWIASKEDVSVKRPDFASSKINELFNNAKTYLKLGLPYQEYLFFKVNFSREGKSSNYKYVFVVFTKFILKNTNIKNTEELPKIITNKDSFASWIGDQETFFSDEDADTSFTHFTERSNLINQAQFMSKLNNDLVVEWLFTPEGGTKRYRQSQQKKLKKLKTPDPTKFNIVALKLRVVQYNLTRWMVHWHSRNDKLKTNYLSDSQMTRRFDALQKIFYGKNLKYGFFDDPKKLVDPTKSIATDYDKWLDFIENETNSIKQQFLDSSPDERFFIIRITKQGLGTKPRAQKKDLRQIFWKKYYRYGAKGQQTSKREKEYRRALKIIYYTMGSSWREAKSTLFVREDQESIAEKKITNRIQKWLKSDISLDEKIIEKYGEEYLEERKKFLKSACKIILDWNNSCFDPTHCDNKFLESVQSLSKRLSYIADPARSPITCKNTEYLDISPLIDPTVLRKNVKCKTKLKLGQQCGDHESCSSYYCREGRCQCWVGEKEGLKGICEPRDIKLETANYKRRPSCKPDEYKVGELIQFEFDDGTRTLHKHGLVMERLYKTQDDSKPESVSVDSEGNPIYCYRKLHDSKCGKHKEPPTGDDTLCNYNEKDNSCRKYPAGKEPAGKEPAGKEPAGNEPNKKSLQYRIKYRIPNSRKTTTTIIDAHKAFPGYWNPKYRACSPKRVDGNRCVDPEQCLSGQCHADPLMGCIDTKACPSGKKWDVIAGKCITKEDHDVSTEPSESSSSSQSDSSISSDFSSLVSDIDTRL